MNNNGYRPFMSDEDDPRPPKPRPYRDAVQSLFRRETAMCLICLGIFIIVMSIIIAIAVPSPQRRREANCDHVWTHNITEEWVRVGSANDNHNQRFQSDHGPFDNRTVHHHFCLTCGKSVRQR